MSNRVKLPKSSNLREESMDSIEVIRCLIAVVQYHSDDAMKGITKEQFNWAPPGTANTISAILTHYLTAEDLFIQSVIQSKPRIWDEFSWSEKTGIKHTPDFGGNWEEFKHMTVAMEPILAYQKAVRAATDSCLAGLTPDELERKVKLGDWDCTVTDMMIHLARHNLSHAGEISALRGVQGSKGLPY
jgi:uncharacterized damage-inducible protein DinB